MSTNEVTFLGSFVHSVDKQRRVSMPRQWRNTDGDERFYLMPGQGPFVQILSRQTYDDFVNKIRKKAFTDQRVAMAFASLAAKMQEAVPDKQGRIGLSEELKQHAGISKEAVLVGQFIVGQIWDAKRKEAFESEMSQQSGELAGDPFTILNDILGGE